ncbi:MAG TPA: sugar ABC transporter substrate-binding protein [Mycobacteriales bacterium]|nr:sugar ABC transporter substrate-binding protein [Mycobacteriales bacterium]
MKLPRRSVAAGLACVAIGAVAGCGGQGAGTQGGDGKTITLVSWGTNQQITLFQKSLDRFTKKSGIKVHVVKSPGTDYAQKINSQILSKSLPDIFWCQNSMEQDLGRQGKLYDWSKYVDGSAKGAKETGLDVSKFSPGAIDTYRTPDGKVYGIPNEANTYGVFYNADLFKQAGVALPTGNWTWNDLFADAKALTVRNGKKVTPGMQQVWSLLNSPTGMSFYSVSNGGAPLTDNKSLVGVTKLQAGPQFVAGTERLAAAIKNGSVTGPNFAGTNTEGEFINGKVPMVFGGQWISSDFFAAKTKVNWGYAPLPRGTAGQVAPAEANGFCSPSYVKNPSATWKVISWMDTNGFNDAYKEDPIAPIAYIPGSQGYFDALEPQGAPGRSVEKTVRAELANPNKLGTTFLDPWSGKSGNLTTSIWNPALQNNKDVAPSIEKWISKTNAVIGQK